MYYKYAIIPTRLPDQLVVMLKSNFPGGAVGIKNKREGQKD